MAGFVSNIIANSIGGFVSGAVTTVGGYAGDAVSGVGNMIEGAGARVGNVISGSFNRVGQGINAYGTSVSNATAPNAGGGVKKVAVKPAAAQKALPSSKPMKAIGAPPAKSSLPAVKTSYIPPTPVKKQETKKTVVVANGQKKAVAESRSLPAVKQTYTPPTKSAYTPAVPGYASANNTGKVAVKKASSVVGGYKAASPAGAYKSSGVGTVAKSQVGSVAGGARAVAGSVAGGPKFF